MDAGDGTAETAAASAVREADQDKVRGVHSPEDGGQT